MNRKKVFILLLACLALTVTPKTWAQDEPDAYETADPQVIVDFLNQKAYIDDKTLLTESDLKVSDKVDEALDQAGLSVYTLLRNEPFARHGYVFKDPVLLDLYSKTTWYKADPDFRFTQLSPLENKNVEFIKKVETTYDYQNVAKGLQTLGRSTGFLSSREDVFDHDVIMSLNHLRLNPSRLLRNVIYARHGYAFQEPLLKEIFSRTYWYRNVYAGDVSLSQISSQMTKEELMDVELLKKKEWVDVLKSVNFTLPSDMISIPTVGYNAVFIRRLSYKNDTYYYSSQLLHSALGADVSLLNDHKTDVDQLVSPEIIQKIQAEADPFQKLVLFFDHKKFDGYANKIVFNHSDMEIPSYLKEAVENYGLDYRILLRKEIHARLGAKFSDVKTGAIFKRCGWYKPLYNLNSKTESRFPSSVKVPPAAVTNFALLEGEELAPKAILYKNKNMVVDLNGNVYFVKVGVVNVPGHRELRLQVGSDYPSLEAYEKGDLQDSINQIFEKYKFDPEATQEFELKFAVVGC